MVLVVKENVKYQYHPQKQTPLFSLEGPAKREKTTCEKPTLKSSTHFFQSFWVTKRTNRSYVVSNLLNLSIRPSSLLYQQKQHLLWFAKETYRKKKKNRKKKTKAPFSVRPKKQQLRVPNSQTLTNKKKQTSQKQTLTNHFKQTKKTPLNRKKKKKRKQRISAARCAAAQAPSANTACRRFSSGAMWPERRGDASEQEGSWRSNKNIFFFRMFNQKNVYTSFFRLFLLNV